jgi:uncharacterized delta-60 repeat protein
LKIHFPGEGNTGSSATSAALQTDGKLVVGGYYKKNDRLPVEPIVARFNSNIQGSPLDPTFGTGGFVMTKMGLGDAFAFGIAIQSNGRIVLAGYSVTTQDHDFSLIGYTSNGTVDSFLGPAVLSRPISPAPAMILLML